MRLRMNVEHEVAGKYTINADMRDLLQWETYARKNRLPLRMVEDDSSFPQTEYVAFLAWTASKRDERFDGGWQDWKDGLVGLDVDEGEEPDPTKPAAGTG